MPEDAVVYPPAAAGFFLGEAQKYRATLLLGRSIVRASQSAVHLEDGTVLRCGSIVAAIGADTALLPWLPIQKRKGHPLITDRYPEFVHHQLIEIGYLKSSDAETANSVAFNVQPRQTGQLLIGSSRQFGSNDLAVEQGILNEMSERACSYMPALKRASSIAPDRFSRSHPDNLPLIGPADALPSFSCRFSKGWALPMRWARRACLRITSCVVIQPSRQTRIRLDALA